MPSGLIALLDDVATIAKLAASTVDDVAGAAGKASAKAAGVVIDDTAVTPRYVVGLAPERELPIIGKIAWGSIKNKLLFLLPAAILLTAFAPFLITPLLMDSLAIFECERHAVHEGGDHDLLVGQVLRASFDPNMDPLLYFRGKYRRLHFD
jgi:predicted DNA repair protein MutK